MIKIKKKKKNLNRNAMGSTNSCKTRTHELKIAKLTGKKNREVI